MGRHHRGVTNDDEQEDTRGGEPRSAPTIEIPAGQRGRPFGGHNAAARRTFLIRLDPTGTIRMIVVVNGPARRAAWTTKPA
jgi:hypothetical protein